MTELICSSGCLESDAPLQNNFELNGVIAYRKRCTDAVLVSPNIPNLGDQLLVGLQNGVDARAARHEEAQLSIMGDITDHKVHIDRFAILAMAQSDRSAATEIAVVCPKQVGIQQAKYLADSLVMSAFKHVGSHRRALSAGH